MNQKAAEDVYPLTPLQEGLLFHTLLSPEEGAYHDQFSAILHGPLDPAGLQRAWRSVVAHHAIFRTAFAWQSGKAPLQVVGRQVETPFVELDWRGTAPEEQAARRRQLQADDLRQRFDPAKAPLTRITLARLADESWFLLWSRHHLLLDGWSVSLVLREWLTTYQALRAGQPAPSSSAPPFRNYIAWLQRQDPARAEAFWRGEIGDVSQPTPLGLARSEGEAPPADRHGERERRLSPETSEAVRQLARAARVTPATVFQAVWALVLARLAGERDIVFGNTVSGRPTDLPGADAMVGLFINTLPLRVRIDPARPVGDWLRDLQVRTAAAREFEATPLVRAQGWTEVPRDRPLFDTLLVYENYPTGEALEGELGALRVEAVQSHERTHYAATLIVAPGDRFSLLLLHDRARLPDDLAHRWLDYLEEALGALAGSVARPLGGCAILPTEERRQLLETWNDTARAFDRRATLPSLVLAQATRSPSAVAVVDGTTRLTYAELVARAGRLAATLRRAGAGPETCVGVCLERNADLVVSLLGVLLSGAAYVPLDPAYPAERLAFMAGDARMVALVTQRSVAGRLPSLTIPLVWRDAAEAETEAEAGLSALAALDPANLAYLIYTSGSTGRPKATAIEHRQAVAFIAWARTVYSSDELAGVLFSTSVCFDLSIFELFVTLAAGGKVIVAENALALPTLPARDEVTLVNTVPSAATELVRAEGVPPGVVTINLAGEPLTAVLADRLYAIPTLRRVYDLYGPSEDTTYSTCALRERGGPATIGRVIANSRLYLLDPDLEPVPVGAVGELYLAGDGLARGYLGRADLTAERFLPDPFAREPGGRLYRTGDLARFRSDGQIEFLGRGDHQVKIRGFRIELGEIQARIEAHPDVAEAAVLAREHPQRGPYLVAFVAPAAGAALVTTELADWVRATLPHYMVPSTWHPLAALPRTPNGKLDRKALPADHDGPAPVEPGRNLRRATEDPLDGLVAGIWAEVLGLPECGPEANFFELGGHSLLATQVVARVRAALGREVPLRTLFNHPTRGAFVQALRAADGVGDDAAAIPLPTAGDPVLSPAQERMWVLAQIDAAGAAYHIPIVLDLRGALDAAALAAAFTAVLARHESLRTGVRATEDGPRAVVMPPYAVELPVTEVTVAEAERWTEREVAKAFDLERGPLLRVRLLRISAEHHRLVATLHHLVADGWSLGVLLAELAALYPALRAGQPSALAPLTCSYATYAAWQRSADGRARAERERVYWRQQLAGLPALELPTDRPRPAEQSYRGGVERLRLGPEIAGPLGVFARREGATPFMVLLAAFEVLLHRLTGQESFGIGTPVAGRTRPELEPLIGLFVNTLVVRAQVDRRATFAALVRDVRRTALEAHAHQSLPFERVVEALAVPRDPARSPLFQAMFILQNAPLGPLAVPGLTLEPVEYAGPHAKFDLTLAAVETAEGIELTAEYAADLLDAGTVRRWLEAYRRLLGGALASPKREVGRLPLLAPAEEQALAAWSAPAAAMPSRGWIHELASGAPTAPAVVAEGVTLSYADFEYRASRLAGALQAAGVGPEVLVGVYLERSAELVLALHAVLRAGGAYVPLDPGYPPERIAYMVADAAAPVIITTRALKARLPATTARIVWADEAPSAADVREPVLFPGSAAYMIYTSGSTGRPKGAVNTHAGILNRLQWMQSAFALTPADRVLQKTPFSFDVSVWEFFWPLMTGATLVVAEPEAHRDPARLIELICGHGVTTIHFVPSMLRVFLDAPGVERCTSLRLLVCSGEELPRTLVTRCYERMPWVQVHNLYGPTEAAVDVTWHACRPGDVGAVPIGRPIANLEVQVLDPDGQPVPIGVAGEIHLGGVGLGRGYHGRPDLTAERWVPHPTQAGARLYRTGDLGRWTPQGEVEYLGRTDFQVKLRGLRIELGEIEAVLRAQPGVRDAVVALRRDGAEPRLVGYVASAEPLSTGQLEAALAERLPAYMVPASWVVLETFPLTPSGKTDRNALPAPAAPAASRSGTLPIGPLEERLAGWWRELLRVPVVHREDNFFTLGGDSILSLQVVARAAAAGIRIPAQAVFRHPTLAQLAAVAEVLAASGPVSGVDAASEGPAVLTPIQAWFFAQAFPQPAHWNQSALLTTPAEFDPERFARALRRVVARHDVFHLRYERGATDGGVTITVADPASSVQVETAPLSELTTVAARTQAGLDLVRGPLVRAVVFPATAAASGRLLLVIHHLAIDGVSWRWLLEELGQAYRDDHAPLPPVPVSWAAWTRLLAREAASATTRAELPAWAAITPTRLPRDREGKGRGLSADEAVVTVTLTSGETQRLLQQSGEAYRTQANDLLLAALARVLARWAGVDGFTLALEGHGREDVPGGADITRTIGWFTTLYPVALGLGGDPGPGEVIKRIKEQLRAVPRRGLGYGLLRQLGEPAVRSQLAAAGDPDVCFNYLGQVDAGPAAGAATGFAAASDDRGPDHGAENPRTFLLEINAAVAGGELRCAWHYSVAHHDEATIRRQAEAFRTELLALIAHCVDGGEGGLTPSDFPDAEVSQEDLDRLLGRLE